MNNNQKGGINMNYKKLGVYTFLFLFAFQLIFAMSFVAAQPAGVNEPIDDGIIRDISHFLGFLDKDGNATWAIIIVSIAVLAIIFAAAYDIMGLTAFDKKWVKYTIAAAVALITSVAGGITLLSGFFISIAGGSIVFATILSIIFAAAMFFVGSVIKSWKHKKDLGEQRRSGETGRTAMRTGAEAMADVGDAAERRGGRS